MWIKVVFLLILLGSSFESKIAEKAEKLELIGLFLRDLASKGIEITSLFAENKDLLLPLILKIDSLNSIHPESYVDVYEVIKARIYFAENEFDHYENLRGGN